MSIKLATVNTSPKSTRIEVMFRTLILVTAVLKRLVPKVSMTGFIGILALFASTYLSAKGIHYALSKADIAEEVRLAVSVFGTFLLTGLAFTLWMRVGKTFRERKIRSAIGQGGSAIPITSLVMAALFALFITMMSVTTATVALTHINHQKAIQQLQNRQTFREVIAPVEAMNVSLAEVAAVAERAAALAAARSDEERDFGNTCAPARPTRPGPGPVTSMRANHASEAATLATEARQLSEAAQGHIAKLSAAKDQAAVVAQVDALRALRSGGELNTIGNGAQGLAKGYDDGGFVIGGQHILCSDPELQARFLEIEAFIDSVPNLPLDTPIRRDATIFDTFALLGDVLLGSSSARAVGLHPAALLPFIALAILFDMISAIGACSQGKLKARRLDSEEATLHRKTLWILEHFFVLLPAPKRLRGDKINPVLAYFICPIVERKGAGNPKYMKGCKYLIEHFELVVDPEWQDCEIAEIDPTFTEMGDRWLFASGGATHFDVYPIESKGVMDEIIDMKRAATLLLGIDEDTRPTEFPDFIKPRAA